MELKKVNLLYFFIFITFFGCVSTGIPKPSNTVITTPSPTQLVQSSISPQIISPTPSGMPTPSPTQLFPSGTQTGNAPNVLTTNILGNVYDKDSNPVSNATVKLKTIYESNFEVQTDENGFYFFRSILSDTKIELTVSKDGYKTVLRNEISTLEPKLLTINGMNHIGQLINFGGQEAIDKAYALIKQ